MRFSSISDCATLTCTPGTRRPKPQTPDRGRRLFNSSIGCRAQVCRIDAEFKGVERECGAGLRLRRRIKGQAYAFERVSA
jgi:hypothetical protein